MPNQHTKKAAEQAAKQAVAATQNSENVIAHGLDEAAQAADKLGGKSGNLGLAFGGLAVAAASAAFALTKFRRAFTGE